LSVKQTVALICLLGFATGTMSLLLKNATEFESVKIFAAASAIFAAFVVMERVKLKHADSRETIICPGVLLLPDNEEKIEINTNIFSAKLIEFAVSKTHMKSFYELFINEKNIFLNFESRKNIEALKIKGRILGIFKTENPDLLNMHLYPVYDSPGEQVNADKWISYEFYPSRETKKIKKQ
jgi:hypothetical protein